MGTLDIVHVLKKKKNQVVDIFYLEVMNLVVVVTLCMELGMSQTMLHHQHMLAEDVLYQVIPHTECLIEQFMQYKGNILVCMVMACKGQIMQIIMGITE